MNQALPVVASFEQHLVGNRFKQLAAAQVVACSPVANQSGRGSGLSTAAMTKLNAVLGNLVAGHRSLLELPRW